ncbi:MAG: Zn-dependent hydrolase [Bacteroidales bacterium]|nr:Zn-dependent hydrolase [Bacteroidales bacterium]
MKNKLFFLVSTVLFLFILGACKETEQEVQTNENDNPMKAKTEQFISFKLTANTEHLSDNQKQMLPLLFEAADICNEIYWTQAYGDKTELFTENIDEYTKKFLEINYGPWERLNGNKSFIEGINEKPKGANFYPADMTEEEFENIEDKNKTSLYTLIQRDENGKLKTVWYHDAYKEQTEKLADLLKQAAELADDEGFKNYLNLRAEALLTDDYLESDMAWMDMKNNDIDFVVGPIENYEDALYGYKAAHEAFILIKDKVWSDKLAKYAAMLPDMQKALPVTEEYKQEVPGRNSDLGAYDVVYYAGDCNAGSKTIAINLPNDKRVHLAKGSRRLQLKNAMQAKFDKILIPISKVLIAEEQQKHITFDAFFENTMFHETAHGLGIKYLLNDKTKTVGDALKEYATTIEEGKADILGLFFVTKLFDDGEFPEKDLMDNYVTFMAGIFRSVRFGVSSSHGKANMLRFFYFKEMGAFSKDTETGQYSVNFEKMKEAMNSLTEKILVIQGDGNYAEAKKWIEEKGKIGEELKKDLEKVNEAGIPVDIVFEQGLKELGL